MGAGAEGWKMTGPILFSLAAAAAVIAALVIALIRPLLVRYALARPNARSSHMNPTPQGGGIGVIAAMIILFVGIGFLVPAAFGEPARLGIIFANVIALAVIGATDDIRPLEALPRLALQGIAVIVVLATIPFELRLFSGIPWWVERGLIFFAVLWFVNLTNFMDGIDWMTVVEVVPITAALSIFGLLGVLPPDATMVAAALGGAMLGFAPFNRPVAKLFLGDVGSLPIGLILGYLLLLLAIHGHITAALLLPLYYVADATITLLRRLINGDQVTQAHRSHFYQQALKHGFSVYRIVGSVFVVNVILTGLATVCLFDVSTAVRAIALAAGCILVTSLLFNFRDTLR